MMSYFEILSLVLRGFQEIFEQSDLFVRDVGTIRLN